MAVAAGTISLVFLILELLTAWKVFVKYGEPGWKGLIPFYSDYVEYGKVWSTTTGIVYIILVIAAIIFGRVSSTALQLVGSICQLAYFIVNILFSIRKSKAFGKGAGMAIVLILFPFIGNLVLGFGDAEYQGKQA